MKVDQHSYFDILEVLGEGSHGKVVKARNSQNGQMYALKIVKSENKKQGFPTSALRQISILKRFQHQNLIKLIDVLPNQDQLIIVLEYVKNDLRKIFKNLTQTLLPFSKIKDFTYQILSCLALLHDNNIFHRDLKPENLLIDQAGRLRVADFGLALDSTFTEQPFNHHVVTFQYRAPQLLLGASKYDGRVDIWSVGCILVEMIIGKLLFCAKEQFQLDAIFSFLGTPSKEYWPEMAKLPEWKQSKFTEEKPSKLEVLSSKCPSQCFDLIKSMLELNPNKRITAKNALNHPFFSKNIE